MDLFWTVARVVVSLAVVLGLLWVLGQAARRRGMGGGAQAAVSVIGRQALSRSASVVVVSVIGCPHGLVLGVTDSSVTLLGSVDPDEVVRPAPAPAHAAATTTQQGVPAFEHVLAAVGSQPQPVPQLLPQSQLLPQPATRAEVRARAGAAPVTSPGPGRGAAPSVLAGSALSPATWTRAVGALRERSARR